MFVFFFNQRFYWRRSYEINSVRQHGFLCIFFKNEYFLIFPIIFSCLFFYFFLFFYFCLFFSFFFLFNSFFSCVDTEFNERLKVMEPILNLQNDYFLVPNQTKSWQRIYTWNKGKLNLTFIGKLGLNTKSPLTFRRRQFITCVVPIATAATKVIG